MHQAADYLVYSGADDQDSWLSNCQKIVEVFCKIASLESAKIYSRKKKFFELQSNDQEHEVKVYARDILKHQFKNDEFIKLSDYNDLIKKLKATEEDFLYNCQSSSIQNYILTTLVVIKGEINKKNENFTKDFFRIIARVTTISSLYFSLEDTQSKFRKEVGNVAHDNFNTLQRVFLDLDFISSSLKTKEIEAIKKPIQFFEFFS